MKSQNPEKLKKSEVAPQVDFTCDLGQVSDQVDLRVGLQHISVAQRPLDTKLQVKSHPKSTSLCDLGEVANRSRLRD